MSCQPRSEFLNWRTGLGHEQANSGRVEEEQLVHQKLLACFPAFNQLFSFIINIILFFFVTFVLGKYLKTWILYCKFTSPFLVGRDNNIRSQVVQNNKASHSLFGSSATRDGQVTQSIAPDHIIAKTIQPIHTKNQLRPSMRVVTFENYLDGKIPHKLWTAQSVFANLGNAFFNALQRKRRNWKHYSGYL